MPTLDEKVAAILPLYAEVVEACFEPDHGARFLTIALVLDVSGHEMGSDANSLNPFILIDDPMLDEPVEFSERADWEDVQARYDLHGSFEDESTEE